MGLPHRRFPKLATGALWAPALLVLALAPVPFWGARESSPVGTDPAKLRPGQFIWDAPAAPEGPIVIVVSIPDQIARVYRNGVEVGVAKVSTGKPGHTTPTGVFTILNKDRDHRSKTYNDAPMPYSERLTWDGVALHAGGIPGYPESHGCVHLPSRFAELLFGITSVGMTVVIANDVSAPSDVAHPGFVAPVTSRGAEDEESRMAGRTGMALAAGEIARRPGGCRRQRCGQTGPGRAQRRRDRPRGDHHRRSPEKPLGNEAYVLKSVPGAPADSDSPAGTRWLGIALTGANVAGGTPLDLKDAARVSVPPPFAAELMKVLRPGSTLYVTDAAVLSETTGKGLNVLNSDPPSASPPS